MKKQKNHTAKVRSTYSWYAKFYDSARKLWNPFIAASAEKRFNKLLGKYLRDGMDILDVGVGTGLNIERVLSHNIRFSSYEGIDLAAEMLMKAKQKFGQINNIKFHAGDITKMKIRKKYNAIISTLVFSHLDRQDEVLNKLLTALKSKGVLLLLFISAKPKLKLIDKLGIWIYRIFFHFTPIPLKVIQKFPPSELEEHFSCLGGRASIYVFVKK